jgi:hypothetical protein
MGRAGVGGALPIAPPTSGPVNEPDAGGGAAEIPDPPPDEIPPEPLEPLPADLGIYRGQTGQAGELSFRLAEVGITSITFQWLVAGCSGLSGGPLDVPVRPVDGRFEIVSVAGPGGVSATIRGGFDSRTRASGTATYETIPSIDGSACTGSDSTTWSAELVPNP